MKITFLGAHNFESRDSRCVCLLIDEVLAVDAGALTSSLTFDEQQNLKAVLLTHQHYDHIRDIPALAINFFTFDKTIDVYSTPSVRDALSDHLLNGVLYPAFMTKPAEKPSVNFHLLEIGRSQSIAGYDVLPVPVRHAVPAVGVQITSPEDRSVFYTSDTGPGLADCWRQVSPDLLITEVTVLNERRDFAIESGHLTPDLLREELESFRNIKGYLPQVLLVHTNPQEEKQTMREIDAVEKALNIEIPPAREGMQIEL
jgi:ribonuclease BN (tRNA processing enzyme)